MTELQWILLVFGAFGAVFTAFKWWQKDNRGALTVAAAVIIVAALFFVVGCSISPERRPWMEAGMAYDTQHTVGNDPACIVRIRAPVVPGRIIAGYTHHSSCPDLFDRNTVDQIEVMAIIPLGRRR